VPGWRIYMQRNWRMLSRVGAGVAFALVALLVALPRASAGPAAISAMSGEDALLYSPHRVSSASFASFSGPDRD